MNINRLATAITVATNMACASLAPEVEKAPVEKTRADIGREICSKLGPGVHDIDQPYPDQRAYCFYPQGGNYGFELFDMPPEAKKTTLSELPLLIHGKRVALFGEDHEKKDTPRDQLVDMIADEGFDYLGVELNHKQFQPLIDAYYESDDSSKIEAEFDATHFRDKMIATIIAAKKRGLKITCIDNRQKEDYPDSVDFWNHREGLIHANVAKFLQDGKRIAIIMGSGHITHNIFSDFMNGNAENGMPNAVHLDKPTGYRIAQDIGLEHMVSVGMDPDSKSDRFIDAYLVQ